MFTQIQNINTNTKWKPHYNSIGSKK